MGLQQAGLLGVARLIPMPVKHDGLDLGGRPGGHGRRVRVRVRMTVGFMPVRVMGVVLMGVVLMGVMRVPWLMAMRMGGRMRVRVIMRVLMAVPVPQLLGDLAVLAAVAGHRRLGLVVQQVLHAADRKSTRLNSSHRL